METKVLAAIMKLQAAQIMLADVCKHTDLTIANNPHGCLCLTAFVSDDEDASEAIQILNAYTFDGATFEEQHYAAGTTDAFKTYKIHAYITDLED